MQYYKNVDFSRYYDVAGHGRYCNFCAAFDIETSYVSYPEDYPDKKLAGQPRAAFMYIWQFAIKDTAVYGRTWIEFQDFLERLREQLHLSPDHKLVVYVHNLTYEFTFMESIEGLNFSADEHDLLARALHDVIKCVLNEVYELRDSETYTEMPLSKVGKLVGIDKLDYDYTKLRLPNTPLSDLELEYCEHDVLILTKYFDNEVKVYGSYFGIPLTATKCVKREIEQNLRELYYRGVAIKNQLDSEDKYDMHILDMLQSAYFAPWIYNQSAYQDMVVEDVMDADISSAYPYWMCVFKYPFGEFKKFDDSKYDNIDDILRDYPDKPMLISLRIEGLKTKYPRTAWLPAKDEHWYIDKTDLDLRDKRIAYCKAINLVLTDIDLKTLKEFYEYDKIIIDEIYMAKKYAYLPTYIVKTIIDKYIEKNAAKQWKNRIEETRELTPAEAAEYSRIKSRVDRIYGIFVQKPIRTAYKWDPEQRRIVPGEQVYVKSDNDCSVNFAWGVWLLAYERREMLKIFAACNLGERADGKRVNLDIVLYGDTDSLKFRYDLSVMDIIAQYNNNCNREIEKFWRRNKSLCKLSDILGMGQFNYKHYQMFKCCRIKRYAFVSDLDEFVPVCAGLSADNTYFQQFKTNEEKMEAFTGEMKIPAEIANGKRTQYVYKHYSETLTDEYGNVCDVEAGSYVLIGKTSFNYLEDDDNLTLEDWHKVFDKKPAISRPKKEKKRNATKKSR